MAFPNGWSRQCALTVQGSNLPGNLSSFPALIGYNVTSDSATNLPGEMLQTGNANAAQSTGADIRFSSDSAGASPLHCEIVSFVQNATLSSASAEIWVGIPSLTASTNQTIYVWYNNSSATAPAANDATFGSYGVWTGANYVGVWHLGNAAGVNYTNSVDGTVGTNHSTTGTGGQIGEGMGLVAASSQYVDVGEHIINSGACTIEAWLYNTDFTNPTYQFVASNFAPSSGGIEAYCYINGITIQVFNSGNFSGARVTGVLTNSAWNYVSASYGGGNATTVGQYGATVNGVDKTSALGMEATGVTSMGTVTANMQLGERPAAGYYFNGKGDEYRISSVAQTANWCKTNYANQNSPSTFWSVGTPAATGKLFINPTLCNGGAGQVNFYGNLS
jgi:hypothetical protein